MKFASPAVITSALSHVADAPVLLIVSDFDGTLAEFSADALNVPVNRASLAALDQLGKLPGTHAAVLSGRHLEGLRQVAGDTGDLHLAGSHGAEGLSLTPDQQQLLDQLTTGLEALVEGIDGAFIEHKPVHRVLHYRKVAEEQQADLVAAARELVREGVFLTHGKCIEEFSVVDVNKGTWITQARDRFDATSVVLLGDDVTDENGMRALGPKDLGIRVGEGDTLAHLRVPDTDAVQAILEELLQMRRTVVPE